MQLCIDPGQYVFKQFSWVTPLTVMQQFVECCLGYGYTAIPSVLGYWLDTPYNSGQGSIV